MRFGISPFLAGHHWYAGQSLRAKSQVTYDNKPQKKNSTDSESSVVGKSLTLLRVRQRYGSRAITLPILVG